jgi:sugar phosphate permease
MDVTSLEAGSALLTPVRTSRVRRMQIIALIVMLAGGSIAFIDRTALSVATPLIRKDFGLSMTEMGILMSALSWSYGLVQIPFGIVIDRLRPRIMLSASLVFWSVVQMCFSFSGNFWQFMLARLFLGAGEGPQFPSSVVTVRDWFNVRERGFATGVFNGSSTFGPAVAMPLLSYLMLTLSWRSMFATLGIFGVVVGMLFYAFYRNPQQMNLTADEKAYLAVGEEPQKIGSRFSRKEWSQLFKFSSTWGTCVGWFGVLYGVWLYLGWLPVYLEREHHMSIMNSGWVASIPMLSAFISSLCAGRVMDMLVRRGVSPLNSRRYPLTACLLGSALLTIVVAETPSDFIAVACVSLSMFLLLAGSACVYSTPSIAVPQRYTGALTGIQNLAQLVGSSLPQFLTGYIVSETGSFHVALFVTAGITAVSAVIYFSLVRRPISEEALQARIA